MGDPDEPGPVARAHEARTQSASRARSDRAGRLHPGRGCRRSRVVKGPRASAPYDEDAAILQKGSRVATHADDANGSGRTEGSGLRVVQISRVVVRASRDQNTAIQEQSCGLAVAHNGHRSGEAELVMANRGCDRRRLCWRCRRRSQLRTRAGNGGRHVRRRKYGSRDTRQVGGTGTPATTDHGQGHQHASKAKPNIAPKPMTISGPASSIAAHRLSPSAYRPVSRYCPRYGRLLLRFRSAKVSVAPRSFSPEGAGDVDTMKPSCPMA